jgi:hypothetical protein
MPRGFRWIKLALELAAKEVPRLTAMLDLVISKPNLIPRTQHPPHPVQDRRSKQINDEQGFGIAQWLKRWFGKHVQAMADGDCTGFLCRIRGGTIRGF